MAIDPTRTLIGQVIPVPNDRHGRNMRITQLGELVVWRHYGRDGERPSTLAVTVTGNVLSARDGTETLLDDEAAVPYEDVCEDDRQTIANRHRDAADAIMRKAEEMAARHRVAAKRILSPERAQAFLDSENAAMAQHVAERKAESEARRAAVNLA